jgi:SAM-dependent methyltransferase
VERQTLENLRGEVEFRRKLFDQQVAGLDVFENEYDAATIEAVLRDRMDGTREDMRRLLAEGALLSPYVELGAERGQRALVMENDLGLEGAAVDISFDLLKSCAHYASRFGLERLPLRLCTDAYHLPFRSGSIPFVFSYQTLHHFPDPTPIVREVHRVLAPGGYFLFAEEPYKRVLKWELYEVRSGARGRQGVGALRRLADRLFAHEVHNEEDFGVVENHSIPLSEWRRIFGVFEERRVTLTFARGRRTELYGPRNRGKFLAARLLGGAVSGVCRKIGGEGRASESILDALVCPVALEAGREAPLRIRAEGIESGEGRTYPVADGVAFLLADETLAALYPDLRT